MRHLCGSTSWLQCAPGSCGYVNAKHLVAELLYERGITLTPNAVWRIVAQEPERISFKVLIALCHGLDVTPTT